MSERLQKLLARHGLGSRRQIEDWIAAGRVLLNGSPAQLGDRFTPGDRLVVDGRDLTGKLAVESTGRVIAYHKTVGEVVATVEGEDATSLLDKLPAEPDDWFAGAKEQPGSWWADWIKWLGEFSGKQVPARVPGKGGKLKAIEDAPGTYVKAK